MKVEPAQPRMSDMYMMIDDHLAWNMSSSDLESTRPGSSGTLFVDFDAAGDIEVSYRNGVNKKLPTPPVPAKPTLPRREVQRKESKNTKTATRKPLPPRPSLSSRHNSIISTGHEDDEHIDPFSFPTPQPPTPPPKSPRRSTPEQSPTAPPSNGTTYTDPSGLLVRYHAPNTGPNPAPHAYVSGYDPATHYAYGYDGRIVHVHGSPTPSRPGSYTSEYIDVSAAGCRRSSDSVKVETAFPALQGARGGPKVAKRRRVMRFVQKLLGRLEGLGVGGEVREKGYVT
ncbi:hypothetical protein EJ07DRAFT_179750 [Lizonia empirigonia]|nr:hypothetical protein EJ07DRAFT_179750 [Lizonia empirigonia]